MTELSMYRGDSLQYDFQVFQPTGAPKDLTGYKAWFTAKYYAADPDQNAPIRVDSSVVVGFIGVTFPDPLSGKIHVGTAPLSTFGFPDGPVRLVYDIQIRDPFGLVTTVDSGVLTVNPDVTRSIA